jgi:hypothetical protein
LGCNTDETSAVKYFRTHSRTHKGGKPYESQIKNLKYSFGKWFRYKTCKGREKVKYIFRRRFYIHLKIIPWWNKVNNSCKIYTDIHTFEKKMPLYFIDISEFKMNGVTLFFWKCWFQSSLNDLEIEEKNLSFLFLKILWSSKAY